MEKRVKILVGMFMLMCIEVLASSSSTMVWEEPAKKIQESISGPMAMSLGLVSIIVTAIIWAFTDGSFMGKAIKIVIALSLVGGATQLISLFGISSGMIF